MSRGLTFVRAVAFGAACAGVVGSTACKDLAGTQPLPPNTPDPGTFETESGAVGMYRIAVARFEYSVIGGSVSPGAFLGAAVESGVLTDELQVSTLHGPPLAYTNCATGGATVANNCIVYGDFALDARVRPVGAPDSSYAVLQAVRARAAQGIGALAKYASSTSPALRGHLYALEGYAELLLADLYCSGVPLTSFDFGRDFTYRAGSTTAQVYQHAAALFDTAVTLSADSARIQNLARVGRGRTLLNLGQYAAAATAVRDVPTNFSAQFLVDWSGGRSGFSSLLTRAGFADIDGGGAGFAASVSDREGGTGLPYRSSNDPRTSVYVPQTAAETAAAQNRFGAPMYFPAKFGTPNGVGPMTVADGIEARLIEAEAALHGVGVGRSWLTILNELRQLYAPSLPNIVDPGTLDRQVDTLFAERAAWLFLTGHRQGDLRRLVRPVAAGGYGRSQNTAYPSGAYPVFTIIAQYGTAVNVPIPTTEQANPLFHGCLDRGA